MCRQAVNINHIHRRSTFSGCQYINRLQGQPPLVTPRALGCPAGRTGGDHSKQAGLGRDRTRAAAPAKGPSLGQPAGGARLGRHGVVGHGGDDGAAGRQVAEEGRDARDVVLVCAAPTFA